MNWKKFTMICSFSLPLCKGLQWKRFVTLTVLTWAFLSGSSSFATAQCLTYGGRISLDNFACSIGNEGEICFVTQDDIIFPLNDCADYVVEIEFPTGTFQVTDLGQYTYGIQNSSITVLRRQPDLITDALIFECFKGQLLQSTPVTFIVRIVNIDPPYDILLNENFVLGDVPVIGSPGTTTLLSSQIDPAGPLLPISQAVVTGQRFKVEGRLVVDTDYFMGTLSGGTYSEIAMGTDAEIEVKSGITLGISFANIYGCGNPWDRINVLSGGTLSMIRTNVRDADVAIEMQDNSTTQLTSCVFKENNIGIGSFGNNPKTLNLNFFNPSTFRDGNVGMDLETVSLLFVPPITFRDLNYGIVVEETDLSLLGTFFINCDMGLRVSEYSDLLTFSGCNFQGGRYGIYDAEGTGFTEVTNGCSFVDQEVVSIFKFGGLINDMTQIEGSVFDSENNISVVSLPTQSAIENNEGLTANTNNVSLYGIGSGTHEWVIQNNALMGAGNTNNEGVNFRLLFMQGAKILNNPLIVSLEANMDIQSGDGIEIGENIMYSINQDNLLLDNSTNAVVRCNEILFAQTNMTVTNNCMGADIKGNTFTAPGSGFNLVYGSPFNSFALTGPQAFKGNKFDLSSNSNIKAVNYNDPSTAGQNRYTVSASSTLGDMFYPYHLAAFPGWFVPGEGTNFTCSEFQPGEDQDQRVLGSQEHLTTLPEYINSIDNEVIAFEAKLKLYRQLTTIASAQSLTPKLQLWYNQQAGTSIESIVRFENTFKDLSTYTDAEALEVERLKKELQQLIRQLETYEWNNEIAAEQVVARPEFLQQSALKKQAQQKLELLMKTKQKRTKVLSSGLNALARINQEIGYDLNVNVQNIKITNELLLKRLGEDYSGFTESEIATLASIASQCVSDGGSGVYHARNLWRAATANVDQQFEDDCMNAVLPPIDKLQTIQGQENAAIWLAPNPSSDHTTLFIADGLECDTDLVLYNLQGQLVRQWNAAAGQSNIRLSTQGVSAGMYVLKALNADIPSLKLIVR